MAANPQSNRSPLRILLLTTFPPGVGGGELQTALQAEEMARRGHQVSVIDLRPRHHSVTTETIRGVEIIRLRTPRAPLIRALSYHVKVMIFTYRLGRRADVTQFNHIGTALFSAAPILRALGIPRVLVVWGSAAKGVGPFRQSLRLRLARWLARQHDEVIGLATAVCRNLAQWGFDPSRLRYVPNGVDTAKFQPGDRTSSPCLPSAWPTQGPVVISVGRLVRAKALDILFDAWSQVVRRHSRGHLVLVGDGPLREELMAKAQSLGIADRVLFLGEREDVPSLLRLSEIYVSASRTEGMSNAILEALSSGLPVVATRVGGAQDVIQDGKTGFLVEPENINALAQAMDRLLADSYLRSAMGTQARESTLARYSIGAVVEQYLDIYYRLTAR